jgi:hypothetical protein
MTSLLRAAVACLAVLSLVVVAGCGGDTKSKNDYVSAINKVQTDFADNVNKVGAAPAGGDPVQAAKDTFSNLKTAIDKVIADLRAVKPPDQVKTLHNQLITEMTEFNAQVKLAGDSLSAKDPQTLISAQSKFATSASTLGTRISKTITDINTKLHS